LRVAACVDASQAALCELTGSLDMSVFQTLSAGNTWQVVFGTTAAITGPA
jgi:hypothetical protein